mmetsp:Transcript_78717/g.154524  ORF Transcript_78717/g.154524 Transcript_78717/m.154524 type:complete len:103 (-) Transcript_78717:30-338(-)
MHELILGYCMEAQGIGPIFVGRAMSRTYMVAHGLGSRINAEKKVVMFCGLASRNVWKRARSDRLYLVPKPKSGYLKIRAKQSIALFRVRILSISDFEEKDHA